MTEPRYSTKLHEALIKERLCNECSIGYSFPLTRQNNEPKVCCYIRTSCSRCDSSCECIVVLDDDVFSEFKEDYENSNEQPHVEIVRCIGSNSMVVLGETFLMRH